MSEEVLRWKIGEKILDLTNHAILMGVLNVTPDSFSDGGRFFSAGAAIEHGLEMANKGAGIIDVGGESARPGAQPVAPNEQIERVLPVIEQLAKSVDLQISIDTSSAAVARAALAAGASVINDVTGGCGDERMFPLAAETGAAIIIMH